MTTEKYAFFALIGGCFLFFVLISLDSVIFLPETNNVVDSGHLLVLKDITPFVLNDTLNQNLPGGVKRIFYIETSGKAKLTARMVCTLESVGRVNPEVPLIVVFTKPATILDLKENAALMQILLHPNNVHLTTLDVNQVLNNSVFSGIEERFNRSISPLQHVSDALRLFLVWKAGGIYMDLDMVFHKNLTHLLGKNFIYAASVEILNNCLFGFRKAHPLLEKLMRNMMTHYVPENYAAGPSTFGYTLTSVYNKTEEALIKLGKIDDVLILPHYEVGPVLYMMWDYFFAEAKTDIYRPMMESGIAFHFWNKLTWNTTVLLNSTCSYARIARNFCPRSFWSCDTYF